MQEFTFLENTSSDIFTNNYAQTSLDSFMFAKMSIDAVIEKGSKIIYNRYLQRKLPKHFAKHVGRIYEELQVQEIRSYDPGETVESYLINWMEEDEPEKSSLDSWCPNSVQINQPAMLTPQTHTMNSLTSLAESYQSGKSRAQKRFSIHKTLNTDQNLKKSIIKEEKHRKGFESKNENEFNFYKIPGMEKQYEDDEESATLRKEREDQRKQKLIEAQQNKQRIQEEKEKEEKKKKIESQIKNKSFTFDYEGNPVFLNKTTKISKLPNNEYIRAKFDLHNDLKVLKTLPDDPFIREDSQDNDPNKISLSIVNKRDSSKKNQSQGKEGSSHFLPIVSNLGDILEARAGVKISLDEIVREGPEFKGVNKMRRDEYIKKMEERKRDRFTYYKNMKDQIENSAEIILEDEENPEILKHKLLVSHLRKLKEMGKFSEIEIHEQEHFIEMVMEEVLADPRLALDEKKKREKILQKLEKMREEDEEAKRENKIENRVNEYQRLPIIESEKKSKDRPSTTNQNHKPNKIQKAFDAYNHQLLENRWDKGNNSLNKPFTPSPKVPKGLNEIKDSQKVTTLGNQIFKEPRERITVGQKKILQIQVPTFQSPKNSKPQTTKESNSKILTSPVNFRVKTIKVNPNSTPKR